MRRIFALIVALVSLSEAVLLAQTSRGAIRGSVIDPSSAAVAGAQVYADNTGTSIRSTAVTEGDGGFTFSSLAPGNYRLTVEVPGFKKAVAAGVVVHIGETARADIQLEVGSVAESVEVTGSAILVTA